MFFLANIKQKKFFVFTKCVFLIHVHFYCNYTCINIKQYVANSIVGSFPFD